MNLGELPVIYAVEILDQMYVKIGYSKAENVQTRLANMQVDCPFQIKIVALVEGSLMQELALHASLRVAFGRIRVPMPPNEWYPGRLPFMAEFLKQMRLFGANTAMAFSEKYNSAIKQPGFGGGSPSDFLPIIRWPETPTRRKSRKQKEREAPK